MRCLLYMDYSVEQIKMFPVGPLSETVRPILTRYDSELPDFNLPSEKRIGLLTQSDIVQNPRRDKI